MQDSIDYWLASAYKQALPELAQDATPISIINAAMSKMRDQWQKRFDDGAVKLAAWFAQKTKNYADDALKKILADAGFAVPFRMTEQMKIAYGAVISENVGLIRNISEQHLAQIEGMVMRSVQNNQDMGELYAQLKKRYAMTNRRAALIARDQNNKATAVIVKTQQLSIGITKAQWVHSTAGAHPRPSHVKASKDKLVYDIEKGAFIDGKYIWPGTEINCRCVAKSLIPALNPEIYKK
ncbi:MAG: phage head morphogenesis protein [Pseudomonadota bacterium]|nr:phage head morphogenesis protein [Pseudomonadota bacterium]